jgi:pyruvate kinase
VLAAATAAGPQPHRSLNTDSRIVPATEWPLSSGQHALLLAQLQEQRAQEALERVQQARAAEQEARAEARQRGEEAQRARQQRCKEHAQVSRPAEPAGRAAGRGPRCRGAAGPTC